MSSGETLESKSSESPLMEGFDNPTVEHGSAVNIDKDQNKMGAGADELDSLMVDTHDGTQQGGGNQEAAEVNMEATITEDDVVRAGGFGATDDIGSFLPVAVDSTDFEASLRDARDYEEPQGEVSRPGLGWEGVPQTKIEKC